MAGVARQLFRLGVASSSTTRSSSVCSLIDQQDRQQSAHSVIGARNAHAAPLSADQASEGPSCVPKLRRSFQMHVGGKLQLPTSAAQPVSEPARPMAAQPLEVSAARGDFFEGLPLKTWAEALGERVMPTVELVQEEHRRAKAAAAKLRSAAQDVQVPAVPHFLPFTKWAANNKSMRGTLVADDTDKRPKARLSWYHPDDTMVPRGWFTGGLLADLKYYRPFRDAAKA